MKYKNGEILICIKTFKMKDSSAIVFKIGKSYKVEYKTADNWGSFSADIPYFLIDEVVQKHGMDDEYLDIYFTRSRIKKLDRILNEI